MKLLNSVLLIGVMTWAHGATDWPPAFVAFEQIALREPGEGMAFQQMKFYGAASGRSDEIKERWSTAASAKGGARYHALLGWLMMAERDFAGAEAQFHEAIEADSDDAAGWESLGECLRRRPARQPEARAALEKAIGLAAPHRGSEPATLALAESHLATGGVAEAAAILRHGPTGTQGAEEWRPVARHWAQTADRLGLLPAEIARLEAAIGAGDVCAAALLAQSYVAARDFSLARATLATARKAQPASAFLRREALAVAQGMKDTTGIAALLKEEVESAPTPANWRALFFALVELGDREGSRALLARKGASIAASPATWRGSILRLWQMNLAGAMAAFVERDLAASGWEGRITLAELRMVDGDFRGAEEPLWQVLESGASEPALSTLALEQGNGRGEARVHPAFPGADFSNRRDAFARYRENPPAIMAPGNRRAVNAPKPLVTLQDARDLALLYLALMAEKESQPKKFVERLARSLEALPIEERIFAWAAVESPANLIREITASLSHPKDPGFDSFYAEELRMIAEYGRIDHSTKTNAGALAERLPAGARKAVTASSSRAGWEDACRMAMPSNSDFKRAAERYEETTTAARAEGEEMSEETRMACPMSFAEWLGSETTPLLTKIEGAAQTVRCLAAPREATGRSALEFRDAMECTRVPGQTNEVIKGGPSRPLQPESLPEAIRKQLVYPPGGLFSWAETGVLWMVFTNARRYYFWSSLILKLDAEAATLPPERALQTRAAAAYLAWWNGETADAILRMQKLLGDTGNNDVRLGLASMLAKAGKTADAVTQMRAWQPPYPAAKRFAQFWQLRVAAEAGDEATALTLARGLIDEPWEIDDLRGMVKALEITQNAEALRVWRARLFAVLASEQDVSRLPAVLSDFDRAGDLEGVVATAKKILSSYERKFDRIEREDSPARSQALAALENYAGRDAYLEGLAKESAAAPDSLDLRERRAEAAPEAEVEEAWRRVLELRPDHQVALRMLLRKASSDIAAQRLILERLLALAPDETLAQHHDLLFSSYEKAGQLPRLAARISEAPFPTGARWRSPWDSSGPWRSLAQRFIDAGQSDAAVLVLRKAEAVLDPFPGNMRDLLVEQLIKLQRPVEAGRKFVDTLLPDPAALPMLFALGPKSVNDARPALDVAAIKKAETFGAAPELRGRLEKAPLTFDHKAALIFLRVRARDAAVLPALASLGDEFLLEKPPISSQETTYVADWGLPLAKEMAGWPEATEVRREFLTALSRATRWGDRDHEQRFSIARLMLQAGDPQGALKFAGQALRIALRSIYTRERSRGLKMAYLLAIDAGDDALATECKSELLSRITSGEKDALEATLDCLEPAIQAGRPEAPEMLAALKPRLEGPHAPPRTERGAHLASCEQQLQLAQGDLRSWAPVAWLDAERSTPDQSTIAWDVGPEDAWPKDRTNARVSGTPLPQFDGKIEVDLLFGEDTDAMRPLARMHSVGARGIWQGRLPASGGFVRAVITDASGAHSGPSLPFFAGKNLLRRDGDPAAFWGFSSSFARVVEGGPAFQGSYVAWERPWKEEDGSDAALAGRKIEIRPDCDYFLSGWVRAAPRANLHDVSLGWRTYDLAGKQLSQESIRGNSSGKRFWEFQSQRLRRPRAEGENAPLSSDAAWLEPVVKSAGGDFDFAGLSLVEIPPSPPPP